MDFQRDLFTGEIRHDKKRSRRASNRHISQANGCANGHPKVSSNGHSNGHLSGPTMQGDTQAFKALQERIQSLEETIDQLREIIKQQNLPSKEAYTTAEVATILGKSMYTVREWCRLSRIQATKTMCGRGCEVEWRISHEELVRYQSEGLLPPPRRY